MHTDVGLSGANGAETVFGLISMPSPVYRFRPHTLPQKLGVGGIIGVSGLVATVMMSVGLMTVRHFKGEMGAGETSV